MKRLFSPRRWLRERAEISALTPRACALANDLTQAWGVSCTLIPVRSKGGYDQIYHVVVEGERRAVVRMNNPYKATHEPLDPRLPLCVLAPGARLDREWDAYTRLFPLGLSPEPLWRTQDAIVCSWLAWSRSSESLICSHKQVWSFAEAAFEAVKRMHEVGVTHLDLNLGNLLFEPAVPSVAFIDFEYSPADWMSVEQQMAYDYLRLLDDLLRPRRGGHLILAAPERLLAMVGSAAPDAVRKANMGFALAKCQRLTAFPAFSRWLEEVFPRLRA